MKSTTVERIKLSETGRNFSVLSMGAFMWDGEKILRVDIGNTCFCDKACGNVMLFTNGEVFIDS